MSYFKQYHRLLLNRGKKCDYLFWFYKFANIWSSFLFNSSFKAFFPQYNWKNPQIVIVQYVECQLGCCLLMCCIGLKQKQILFRWNFPHLSHLIQHAAVFNKMKSDKYKRNNIDILDLPIAPVYLQLHTYIHACIHMYTYQLRETLNGFQVLHNCRNNFSFFFTMKLKLFCVCCEMRVNPC